MCLWIFFISSQCIWHEAGTEVAAAATTTTANRKPFSAACFRLRASVCAHSVTISSFTKEELLFASKSAYFEISVCIYKKKNDEKNYCRSLEFFCFCVRVHLLVFHLHIIRSRPLSLSCSTLSTQWKMKRKFFFCRHVDASLSMLVENDGDDCIFKFPSSLCLEIRR